MTTGGTKWVRRTYYQGRLVTNEDPPEVQALEVRVFESAPARERVEKKTVVSVGPYETVHITVGSELPCYPEERLDCRQYLIDDVDQAMLVEISKAEALRR